MDVDGDGRDDLLTALHRDPGIYEPYTTFADEIGNPYDDDGGGIPDPDPDPTPEQCPGDPREPEMLTPGYVWHLHRNIGGGFEQSGSTTYAPFSLAPVGNEGSQMGHGTRSAGRSAIRDMDGDGALDLVYTPDARSGTWVVKPYNSRGGFGPEQTWVLPGQLDLVVPSDSETDAFQSIPRRTMTTLGLADVNGDGLPDLVVAPQPLDSSSGAIPTAANQSLVAYPNYGAGFSSEPVPLGTPFAAIDWSVSNGQFRYSDFLRLDVDGDGLVDFLDLSASPPRYFPNAGDLFLAPRSLPTIWSLGQRQLRIVGGEADPQTPASYLWELWSEIADGDGDGLQDLIGISGSSRTILGLAGQNAPPHRLTKVDLGTGASIRFDYRPVTDPEVVVREGGLRSHLPSKFWVVESVTYDQEDARSGPPSVTSYAYANPVYRAEDGDSREAPRFLGFERVTTFEPRGARVERSYRYAPRPTRDARGRLASETTYDGDVPVTHREVDPWAVEPVFGHLATFTHKTAERTFHCARGDSLERCASRSDAALSVEHSYEAWPSEDAPRLYLGVSRVERGSTTGGVMNRVRTERFDVDYTAERTLVTSIYEELGDAFFDASGAAQRKLRTATLRETEYDSRGLVIARHEWINSGRTATTELQYDAAGNPIRMRKPSQVKKGGAFSEIIYGPHALYPSRSVNELGHAVETRYDVGTGRLLEKAGPNPGQYEAFAVDGFGRVLEQTVAIGDSGTPARDYTVMLMQYHDLSRPRRVVEEKRIDLEGSRWTRTEKLYDGRGRLVEEHDALGGFTIYTYDAGGTLASVEVPDPSRRSGSVLYRYERDDLGRTLGFERPDGWGLEFEYDALTTVRTEVTGDGSGGARTLHRDVFGRLVGVSEIGGQQPAETYYSYDGADRIAEIFDADGNTTWIDHDWAGRRQAIERAGRVHQYEYDWNGNLVAEISPVPEGAAVEEYTTTLAYDDLDRLVRRDPAHRGMSLARMNELGIGPVLYHYDGQAGPVELAIGRLSQVSLPFGAVSYAHDTRGLPVSEELALVSMAGLPVVAAEAITRRYNALGLPEMEVAGGDAIVRRYDQRGQAESIFWNQGLGLHRLVEYQRSAAGLVTGELLGFDQERSYGYDVLGRPVGDEIGSRGALAVWRAYEYSDAGDLTEVRGATGSLSAAARFGYDGLHRVLWAEGPASYAGAFAYSPAGNVRSAQVGWPGSAHSRSVDYQYGAVDPQAVDALIQNGSVWASFAYDPAGNMVARRTPEGSLSLTWDGEDQIREAVASDRRGGSGKNTAKNAKSPKAEREIYYYDHEGRRLLAIGADSARLWFGPVETHFDSKGAVTRRYTHVTDGGGVVARIENGTTLEYHYTDALQNLMLVLDAAGNSSAAFLYGAFGEVVHEEGAETHRRQFNGKENDVATGLRYYGARYYDPIALRWNSADPLYEFVPDLGLEEPQRMNRYSFSLNNPLRYYDPDGRDADDDGGTCQIESEDQCAPDADEEAPMSEQETAETAEETETTEVTAGDVVGTLGMMLDYAEKAIEASGGEVPPIVTKLATHVGPMGEVLLLDDIRQDMNKDLSGEQVQRYVDFFVGAGADYVIATGDPVSKGAAAVLKGTYGTTRAFDEKIGLSDAVAEGAWRATEAVSSAANYVYEGVAGWFSD
ncbi:MAG: hypothetical protein AMS19_13990 [Gemmatimonas sp. SG8_23]|nr:MAG: hypothetical protein AMS19_13990 [Gemmatimonas sp. SG8_23]